MVARGPEDEGTGGGILDVDHDLVLAAREDGKGVGVAMIGGAEGGVEVGTVEIGGECGAGDTIDVDAHR